MSWFPSHDPFETDADEQDAAFEAVVEKVGDEIAPGVVVERRKILKLPLALVGALALGSRAPRSAQLRNAFAEDSSERISFDQLLEELQPLGEALVGGSQTNEEAYLHTVASMLQRLNVEGLPSRGRKPPIAITQLRLKPNAAIPYHDHRNLNGVILGLEGEIRIRNFEIQGENQIPAKNELFRIRETSDARVTPGSVSTLARKRDNIHDLRAGEEGGLILDVFTFFGRDVSSNFVTVDEKAVDEKLRIYEAHWRES